LGLFAIGHTAAGMIAAGGALNTGFGQKHRIDDAHLLPMIFVTFRRPDRPRKSSARSYGSAVGLWTWHAYRTT
jgi:hypothetical protein